MDKPGRKKWSSPFYETNIPSQATVEERMKKQWKAFYLRFMLLPKMLLQATDCQEYSCLEAIFCLGLAARELVLGPVVLQFQLSFLCLQIRSRRLRCGTVVFILRNNLKTNYFKTNFFSIVR